VSVRMACGHREIFVARFWRREAEEPEWEAWVQSQRARKCHVCLGTLPPDFGIPRTRSHPKKN
jgi:hypothetical protein